MAGGLAYFWAGAVEGVAQCLGCMRYNYEVTILEHDRSEIEVFFIESKRPANEAVRGAMRAYISVEYPSIAPFTILTTVLTHKRTVLLATCWKWLIRAFTRTADDAVHEWKQANGLTV